MNDIWLHTEHLNDNNCNYEQKSDHYYQSDDCKNPKTGTSVRTFRSFGFSAVYQWYAFALKQLVRQQVIVTIVSLTLLSVIFFEHQKSLV